MSSQSTACAPVTAGVPSTVPSRRSAKIRALSPESLWLHSRSGCDVADGEPGELVGLRVA